MKIAFKDYKKKCSIKTFIIITLFIIITITYSSGHLLNFKKEAVGYVNNNAIYFAQGPTNDTTAPIITFLQPSSNNSVINKKVYKIIANVSDDNPPLFGNVTIQISNSTSFLFNATMIYNGESQWSFNWNNISLYQNRIVYIFQVWAKDSSLNENNSWSKEFYIFLNISSTPPLLLMIIYFIIVGIIFAAVTVYLNKKHFR
ncbi:MAG: hypothetical protein ACFE9Q_05140 [Candidatus Hodarchaeota archaeon]